MTKTRRARSGERVVVAARGPGGAGSRPYKRVATRRDWTAAKERRFLEALADTCNVTLAAKVARVGNSTVYRRRATDAVFRAAWGHAVAQGYARLEVETLERAINGKMRTVTHKDGREEQSVEHDGRIALTLLKMHRDTAREPERTEAAEAAISPQEALDVRDRLLMKLKRVRVQLLGVEQAEEGGWSAIGAESVDLSGMPDLAGEGDE